MFEYYRLDMGGTGDAVHIVLEPLQNDIDLYVKKGALPTLQSYDCRPYRAGTYIEECIVLPQNNETVFIGIHGYESGTYRLKTFTEKKSLPIASTLMGLLLN